MAARKFELDKVYLQGPDGRVWPYEPLLANADGFKPVVPNASAKEEGNEIELETDTANKTQTQKPQTGTPAK